MAKLDSKIADKVLADTELKGQVESWAGLTIAIAAGLQNKGMPKTEALAYMRSLITPKILDV